MTTLILDRFRVRAIDFGRRVPSNSWGLGLCSVLAIGCYALAQWPLLNNALPVSPLMLGVLCGVIVRLLFPRLDVFDPGIAWTLHYVLRAGVVLLGFRLALADIVSVGLAGMSFVVIAVVSTLMLTMALGRVLKLPDTLSILIATGTSICGASAVVAVDGVIKAREQDVVCSVALATAFGTVAMFAYPLIGHVLGLPEPVFAGWIGTSIHEVAQVVASGFTFGSGAAADASLFKLARVALLVPVCAVLGFWWRARRRSDKASGGRTRFPLFILGFVVVVLVNSFLPIDDTTHGNLVQLDSALLAVAMVAMGLQTRVSMLVRLGWRPIVLGLVAALWIGLVGLSGAWLLLG